MLSLTAIHQILLTVLVMTAAVYDIRWRRIPNWVTVSGAVLGFAVNLYFSGWSGLAMAGAGLGLALAIYMPLYLLRAMGAGDAKLMGAVGAMVGPANWLVAFFFSIVISAILGILTLLLKGGLTKALRNIGHILNELVHLRPPYARHEQLDIADQRAMTLPHGAAIALGSLLLVAIRRLG